VKLILGALEEAILEGKKQREAARETKQSVAAKE
jgi:hypothetical protein